MIMHLKPDQIKGWKKKKIKTNMMRLKIGLERKVRSESGGGGSSHGDRSYRLMAYCQSKLNKWTGCVE